MFVHWAFSSPSSEKSFRLLWDRSDGRPRKEIDVTSLALCFDEADPLPALGLSVTLIAPFKIAWYSRRVPWRLLGPFAGVCAGAVPFVLKTKGWCRGLLDPFTFFFSRLNLCPLLRIYYSPFPQKRSIRVQTFVVHSARSLCLFFLFCSSVTRWLDRFLFFLYTKAVVPIFLCFSSWNRSSPFLESEKCPGPSLPSIYLSFLFFFEIDLSCLLGQVPFCAPWRGPAPFPFFWVMIPDNIFLG